MSKPHMITVGNEVLKLFFYIINTQRQDDMLPFEQ